MSRETASRRAWTGHATWSRTLAPVLEARGLDLVDVEVHGTQLTVFADREGGVGLDELADATRDVSAALDEIDPMPGRYTLSVSSPGLERRLRTPAHFARAVGERITVRVRRRDRRGPAHHRDARRRPTRRGFTVVGPDLPERRGAARLRAGRAGPDRVRVGAGGPAREGRREAASEKRESERVKRP